MTHCGEQSPDEDLADRCRAREEAAFCEVYDLNVNRLYRTCSWLLGGPDEAEDAVQLVFTQAFRNIHKFDARRGKLSTWLHGIAVLVVSNIRRGRRRRGRLEAAYGAYRREHPGRAQNPERLAAARRSLSGVRRALCRLPDKTRLPFVLYHGAHFNLAQISEMTGISMQTISDRIRAARRDILRQILSDPLDLPEGVS